MSMYLMFFFAVKYRHIFVFSVRIERPTIEALVSLYMLYNSMSSFCIGARKCWFRNSGWFRIYRIISVEVRYEEILRRMFVLSAEVEGLKQLTQIEALIIPHALREPNSIIVLSFICIREPFT